MGWRIILVDYARQLRNGGVTYLKSADDAEAEAWSRAKTHDGLVLRGRDKVMNVVCAKIR